MVGDAHTNGIGNKCNAQREHVGSPGKSMACCTWFWRLVANLESWLLDVSSKVETLDSKLQNINYKWSQTCTTMTPYSTTTLYATWQRVGHRFYQKCVKVWNTRNKQITNNQTTSPERMWRCEDAQIEITRACCHMNRCKQSKTAQILYAALRLRDASCSYWKVRLEVSMLLAAV